MRPSLMARYARQLVSEQKCESMRIFLCEARVSIQYQVTLKRKLEPFLKAQPGDSIAFYLEKDGRITLELVKKREV